MKAGTCWSWAIATALLAAAPADEPDSRVIATSPPRSAAEQRALFHLPPGFEIELVANSPEIGKPINLNFDGSGRLLVSGTKEYPFAADLARRDTISLLTDADRDGRFEQLEVIAAGLKIPVGVVAVRAGVLAYSIPDILEFPHPAGTARPAPFLVTYSGFDSGERQGMPNAFTRWIDGWVYACHGERNTSVVAGRDGQTITLRGGTTFRMQPDGSRIETFAFGQVNPFGLCFDDWGDVFTADSHSRPASLLIRGATYPSVGGPGDGLGFGPQIMSHYHGSTGIAGIACYAADLFPESYRGSLFLGNPVTGRVNHDRLEPRGSSYVAVAQPDFLTCDDPWFRPVDLQVGPDGALYIADFYSRVISHLLVEQAGRDGEPGRIWRVVTTGTDRGPRRPSAPADLAVASRKELFDCLSHPNLVVRTLATHEFVDRVGAGAIGPLRELLSDPTSHPLQRAHGLWILHRLDGLDDALLDRLTDDADPRVRVQAVKVLAERSGWEQDGSVSFRIAREKLADRHPMVRRAAADALGRHPAASNLAPLLTAWEAADPEDILLVHTIRMALRDNLRAGNQLSELAGQVSPANRRRLADIGLGLRTSQAAQFLLQHVEAGGSDPARLADYVYHMVRYADPEFLPKVHAFLPTYRRQGTETQAAVLKSLYRALKEREMPVPRDVGVWSVTLAQSLLTNSEEAAVSSGLELAWELQLESLTPRIVELAGASSPQRDLRAFAIDALGAVAGDLSVPILDRLLADASEPAEIREKAADSLGRIGSDKSRAALHQRLTAASASLGLAIARALAHSGPGAESLLEAMHLGKASARFLQDPLVDQRLRAHNLVGVAARIQELTAGLPPQDDQLPRQIEAHRQRFTSGKPRVPRGAIVFEKHCARCHQIGGQGTRAGPPLDNIGQRGLDRLLEDILDPHRVVERMFRATTLQLVQGRIVTGLLLRETGDSLVLADANGNQVPIPAADITARQTLLLSPMPSQWDSTISPAEFDDLLAYLLSQRTP